MALTRAIDYNAIVKELIRLAKKLNYHLLTLVPAENGTILRRIQKKTRSS